MLLGAGCRAQITEGEDNVKTTLRVTNVACSMAGGMDIVVDGARVDNIFAGQTARIVRDGGFTAFVQAQNTATGRIYEHRIPVPGGLDITVSLQLKGTMAPQFIELSEAESKKAAAKEKRESGCLGLFTKHVIKPLLIFIGICILCTIIAQVVSN